MEHLHRGSSGRPNTLALDHIDFEERADVPHSGWPFDRRHLEPFYRRAHAVCGLGAFDDESAHWASAERPRLPTPNPDDLVTRVYHAGLAHQFTVIHPGEIRASQNIRLVHRATCCSLLTDGAHRVVGAAVKEQHAPGVSRRRESLCARRRRCRERTPSCSRPVIAMPRLEIGMGGSGDASWSTRVTTHFD